MHSIPYQYYSGDQIKKSEMSRAYRTYGREERRIHDVGGDA